MSRFFRRLLLVVSVSVMLGNLADLAATGLASEPTLRKWLQAQPAQAWIIKRGSNGDAYEIDIPGAIAAWRAEEERKTEEARQRAGDLRQLGLDLGLRAVAEGPVGFSLAERKQLIEEEILANKLAKDRRELVPLAVVVATLSDVLMRFQQRGATFASRLAKKVDLTRDQLNAIDRQIHADQLEMATAMENWRKELGDGGDANSGAAMDDPGLAD
jgi:hypothetical protein